MPEPRLSIEPSMRSRSDMGDMADMMLERWGEYDDSGPPDPEEYLDLTDDELRKATALCRSKKLMSIRSWPHPLSPKQRYCLAAWLADRNTQRITHERS